LDSEEDADVDGAAAGLLSELDADESDFDESDFDESELDDSDFDEECFPFGPPLFPLA
jgi:hypothetical protein